MEAILRKIYENSSDEMKQRIETGMEEGRRAAIEGYKKGAGMVSRHRDGGGKVCRHRGDTRKGQGW